MRDDDMLARRIEAADEKLSDLLHQAAGLPEEHRTLFTQAVGELAAALEELSVAGEELTEQSEELEAAHRQADEDRLRYRELFDLAPEGYVITNGKAVVQEANAEAAAMLGTSVGALAGKPLVLFIKPENHTSFFRGLRRFAKTDRLEDWEIDFKPRRRRAFTASITVTALKGPGGRLKGLRWLIRDVTEKKKKERQALLASFPELSPEPIVEVDGEGRLRYANPAARKLFPGVEADGAGHPWLTSALECAVELRRTRKKSVHREVRIGARWYDQRVFSVPGASLTRIYGRDITERKEAEDALKTAHDKLEARVRERTAELDKTLAALRSEQRRFRDVLDVLPAFIALLKPDYTAAFANREYTERFGDFEGCRCFEALFDRETPCPDCETFRVLETGQPHRWEWEGPDGRDYDVHDFPFRDADGSRLVLEMGIDITERKQAEETARRQAHRYAAMLAATADGFWIHNLEGRFLDVNDTYCRMSGYTREEILGMRVADIEAAESPEEVARHIRYLTRTGFDRFETRHKRKDGTVFDVEVSASYVRATNQVMIFARDITEFKKSREERLRLAAAVEQASEAIALTDADDTIIYINRAFLRLHAAGRGDVLGRKYEDLIRVDIEDEAFRKRLQHMRRHGEMWKARLTRRMSDGVERKMEVSLSAVRDATGGIINYAAIESDVTQEHNLELYVRQLQKVEALGTLAGGIAHDFNNILVPIFLNTELALLDASKGSPLFSYLSLVLEATNRGRELVRQIISFSRQKEQKRGPVDIVRVVREGLKLLRSSTPASITLSERILTEKAFVRGDPTQIHQVVMNIGGNAAYAMREAGGELEVGLSEVIIDSETAARNPDLRPGPYVKLTMRDTGTGMTPEVMSKAFDPFFTTKKPGEGSGMGLAVVLGIVKSHGGAISAASEPEKGTTFFIFLPQTEEPSPHAAPAAGPVEQGKGRILFVDDEDILQRTVPAALRHLGYTVTAVTDAREALGLFRKNADEFDIVITDQTMPRMTGEKLALEMLRLRPGFPILLCTGFSEVIREDDAKSLGIAGFILKPFSIAEIAEKIQSLLKK